MKKLAALFLLAALIIAACAERPDPLPLTPEQIGPTPRATVLWISIDGLRHDYVARAHPPFIEKLARNGAVSTNLQPTFPTLTFPSHSTLATGVTTEIHGITGNSFYDSATKNSYNFPSDESLRTAEPIWTTATRQRIRTAVYDWPLSQKQKSGAGKFPCAYFSNVPYSNDVEDKGRLQNLVDAYEKDDTTNTPPLRLLMGYVADVDHAGHRYGPESDEVEAQLRETDKLIEQTVTAVQNKFERNKSNGESLYVLLTADHGMSEVHFLINPATLIDDASVKIDYSGPIANIFLPPGATQETAAALAKKIRNRVTNIENHERCAAVHLKTQLPKSLHYAHPTRTGDIVLIAAEGYTFSTKFPESTTAIKDGPTAVGPLGMHGYPIETTPNCRGYLLLWNNTKRLGGINLGEVSTTQLHATVCELLGIKPSQAADPHPINFYP